MNYLWAGIGLALSLALCGAMHAPPMVCLVVPALTTWALWKFAR